MLKRPFSPHYNALVLYEAMTSPRRGGVEGDEALEFLQLHTSSAAGQLPDRAGGPHHRAPQCGPGLGLGPASLPAHPAGPQGKDIPGRRGCSGSRGEALLLSNCPAVITKPLLLFNSASWIALRCLNIYCCIQTNTNALISCQIPVVLQLDSVTGDARLLPAFYGPF